MSENIQKLRGESNDAWGARLGGICAHELNGITDEQSIREIVLKYWSPIREEIRTDSIRRVRTTFVAQIASVFPDVDKATPGYYYTSSREREYSKLPKEQRQRYEHLAFWFATSNESRWDVVGDEAREKYRASFEDGQAVDQPSQEATNNQQAEEIMPQVKEVTVTDIKDLPQLLLGEEDTQLVEEAIAIAGIPLPEFVQRACSVYAKTVAGKSKMAVEDLSAVPTQELLTSEKYKTHPNRAVELTRRAIFALENHNNQCTEKEQKWHVNQTAIQKLTGSKPATINKILESYQTRLDDHNKKHDLNPYDNRNKKIKITEAIDLAKVVPDGLDVA
ncbi:hypothetical protein H6G83_25580 [Anabaena azotica FACHB-119]|uniref:Uncharacterized protein n=2 Tax=Anabaena azotica TaxID=197653 RepID=A0ABR8DBT5_9NOST|nr:hypothetical protein [Anabaena azotica FACHB-119]